MPVNTQHALNNAQQVLRNKSAHVQSEDGKMGKQDFMNLFLTQMSNQNPTDPMDSGAMMSQLSQMGSMEQLENLNGEMKSLNKTQGQMVGMQAMNYLDRDVLMQAEDMSLSQGGSAPVYYNLDKDAQQLRVLVEGPDGAPVLKQQLGFAPEGRHRFSWDGKNDQGVMQGDGKYKVSFLAQFADGSSKELASFRQGRVTGIESVAGETWVKAQGRRIPLNEVTSVDNTSAKIFDGAKPLPLARTIAPKAAITEEPKAKL